MHLVDLPPQPVLCRNLVGGQWLIPNGPTQQVLSPYTGQVIGHVPFSTASDVAQAVAAAAMAFPNWRSLTVKERTEPLFRWRDLLLTHLDTLAHCAAGESGKTVGEARAGLLKGIEVAEFALSLQNLDAGASMEVSRGVTCHSVRQPLGVVVGITPFNFPAMVPLWMLPIAITLGNCFILKPSEKVPLTAQRLGELFCLAGYPPGVVSIVNGGAASVEALLTEDAVQAVAFVGSTAAARAVYTLATSRGKRALALGGAKNHVILVPDADPALSVKGIVDSFTGCAGQRCMAASLLLAVGDVEPLLAEVTAAAARLQLGSGMGALINPAARERLCAAIERAVADGARLRLDGRTTPPPAGCSGGCWLGPTIIDDAEASMDCATSELFGPVLTIVRVPDLSAALAIDAASPYGNATSVFTSSAQVARHVITHATSGMLGVNIGVPVPREPFSFGGTKASKFGHGDITGTSAVDFWSQLTKITTKWSSDAAGNWMS